MNPQVVPKSVAHEPGIGICIFVHGEEAINGRKTYYVRETLPAAHPGLICTRQQRCR